MSEQIPWPQPVANLCVHLPNGQTRNISVTPHTTLLQILQTIGLQHELFEGTGPNTYLFVNEGGTAMIRLTMNMLDYNYWYVERGSISQLYIKRRADVENPSW
jgi:hypothetical protein